MEAVETEVIVAVAWLRLIIESVGALVIAIGMVVALVTVARGLIYSRTLNFTRVRLTLARYLALALEFQLGADILTTAIAPSWDQIGKLGAIAVIRTALNFFLSREMKEEASEIEEEQAARDADAEVRLRDAPER